MRLSSLSASVALTCLLALAGSPLVAANAVKPNYDKVANQHWRCRSCPFEIGTKARSSISTSALQTNDSDARFGRDNGLVDDSRGTLNVSGTYFSRDAKTGRVVSLIGTDLGLDSKRLAMTFAQPRRYAVDFSWREIPRNEWLNALTPFQGDANLRLPMLWTTASSTKGMTDLTSASRAAAIGTQRERANLRLAWHPGTAWTVEAGLERETRKGRQLSSGDFLYQATALIVPIDYTTETLNAALRYESRSLLLGVHILESEFQNGNRSLTWQNPYWFGLGTPEEGRKALAPDNEATEWGLTFRTKPWAGSVLRGHARRAELRQNDAFLPSSVYPVVPPPTTPPPPSLDGQVDTFASNLEWVVDLGNWTRLRLTRLERERDNNTRPLALVPVLGERFPGPLLMSRHYSFKRSRLAAEATFKLSGRTRLIAGLARDDRARSLLEIESNEEDQQWLALRVRMPRSVRLSLSYSEADRNASDFIGNAENNSLTRRYFMAVREQRAWHASVSAQLGERLSVSVTLDRLKNTYPSSTLGLLHHEDQTWSSDLTWRISNEVHVSLHRSKHEIGTDTAGSSTGGPRDWQSGTRDIVRTTTADLEVSQIFGRVDLRVTLDHSDGSGRYDTDFSDVLSVFPELVSEHRGLDVRLTLPFGERYSAQLRYYKERYASSDWQLDGVEVDTIPSAISFGLLSPNYNAKLMVLTVDAKL